MLLQPLWGAPLREPLTYTTSSAEGSTSAASVRRPQLQLTSLTTPEKGTRSRVTSVPPRTSVVCRSTEKCPEAPAVRNCACLTNTRRQSQPAPVLLGVAAWLLSSHCRPEDVPTGGSVFDGWLSRVPAESCLSPSLLPQQHAPPAGGAFSF